MWRSAPESKLVVSFKHNPSEASHAECENRGYTNLVPEDTATLPALIPGQAYELSAEINADRLVASINGRPVWRGRLPVDALKLKGPAGLRSDNVEWTLLDFDVRSSSEVEMTSPQSCKDAR
jgi:hypothetical protein